MDTAAFLPFWSKGKDNFLSDPPNADLSILEGDKLQQVVVVLENPELNDNNLTYTVKVVGGEMPEKGSEVSVFIDIIGMPLTPLSYAGVARRGYRRAFLYYHLPECGNGLRGDLDCSLKQLLLIARQQD
ncbi:hypothetical protein BLJAPNOD_06467 [Ensifer sp. M14]|uniref:Uncharacterized protein n=1 Tax=Sinorhizobium sp. M14 TaxID=430451 RepID=A0A142BP95_9HYPH|nr:MULTISPECIES: hypothetical protein [Sinorhizobium/Ensifer group]AMP34903.1 hypothetical protein pSinB_037 [Sinorhizobium sp. M14]RDL46273.1 hypothetical protein BLJAPNOD_06467 [Ensifer sp. M14]